MDLRAEGPIVWVPELELFAVTRYAEICQVLANPSTFSSAIDARGPHVHRHLQQAQANLAATSADYRDLEARLSPDWRRARVLLATDPPKHAVQRRLINRLFTPRRVEAMRPRVQAIADELLDKLDGRDTTDLISAFAVQLPLRVIAEQLAIGVDRLGDFKRWSDHFVAPMGDDQLSDEQVLELTRTAVEFSEHFRGLLEARRIKPQEDFLTLIAQADDEDVRITEETRLGMVSALLGAGNETSTRMIGSAILLLWEHPGLAERLVESPARVEPFIHETLRLRGPAQGNYRRAVCDTSLGGVDIPAGADLLLFHASGNRSPDEFVDPDDLDLDRPNGAQHLAFGRGIHYCVGATLARMEGQIAVATLLRRAYPWQIVHVEHNRSYLMHGPRRLLVRFDGPIRVTGPADAPRAAV
jgi:cytochrome P450